MERITFVLLLGVIVFIAVFFRMMILQSRWTNDELLKKHYLIALLWATVAAVIFYGVLLRDV
jgi:hypothetical protein